MPRFRATVAALSVLVASCLHASETLAQSLIATPGTSGDQLLFFYDATAGHAPFLVVSNVSPAALTIEIAWYSQGLTQRLATQVQTLAIGANVILDPSQVQGVSGNAGITVVTPIMSASDARPVVPPPLNDTLPAASSGPLVGGFTLADLSTNSAFGQNPLARVAVDSTGARASAGAIVDGTTIRYQRIAPNVLLIPFYFNPNGAVPLANRAILGAFEDRYAANGFSIGPVAVDLGFGIVDASGNDVGNGTFPVNGVGFTDVQSLAGATPLTSSGKVVLGLSAPLPANANLVGLMSQSLGTFAVGQGMPGYFEGREPQNRLIANSDFDLGNVGWGEESPNFPGGLIVEGGTGGAPTADSGTRLAWLGRINGETSELSQVIAVPTGIGPSFLRFRYQIVSDETNCSQVIPADVLALLINGVQTDGITVCAGFNTGPTWTDFSFATDLAAYAGKTIALRIRMRNDGNLPSSVSLDSLGISPTP